MAAILHRLGRVMQLVGLLLLPLAIAGNLSPQDPLSLKTSLMISGIGIACFFLGFLLQNASRPGS